MWMIHRFVPLIQSLSELYPKYLPVAISQGFQMWYVQSWALAFLPHIPHPRIPACPFPGLFQLLLETSQKTFHTFAQPPVTKTYQVCLQIHLQFIQFSPPFLTTLLQAISHHFFCEQLCFPQDPSNSFSTLQPEWPFTIWVTWCHAVLNPLAASHCSYKKIQTLKHDLKILHDSLLSFEIYLMPLPLSLFLENYEVLLTFYLFVCLFMNDSSPEVLFPLVFRENGKKGEMEGGRKGERDVKEASQLVASHMCPVPGRNRTRNPGMCLTENQTRYPSMHRQSLQLRNTVQGTLTF